ncbi:C10 family peptidase [Alistipes sp.]|uniref:C10 family peptidase n=1 Tax=Alistipes sp. TaxID=1872444 RepID=UPI003AEFA45D
MEKLWLLGCLLLAGAGIASCEKEGTKRPAEVPGAVPYGERVGYEEACQIARAAVGMLNYDDEEREFDPARVQRYPVAGEDPLLYVFSFGRGYDGGGFVVVSTDRRVGPLLAVVESGFYNPGRKTPRNVRCGYDLYVNAALDLLEGLRSVPDDFDRPQEAGRMVIRYDSRPVTAGKPMIPTIWGQESPFFIFCPMVSGRLAPAGFAAVAVGQIMAAYTWPATMTLTYPDAGAASIALNWPGILQHHTMNDDSEECLEHRAIGRLCREIGQQLNTVYDSDRSTADFSLMPACLARFGFAADPVADYTPEAMRRIGQRDGLACMRGAVVDVLTRYEFVWAVDGRAQMVHDTEIWFVPENGGPARLVGEKSATQELVHCNWGHDGYWNGYFDPVVFDPANPAKIEEESLKLRLAQFIQSLQTVTGIKPQR